MKYEININKSLLIFLPLKINKSSYSKYMRDVYNNLQK